MCYPTDIDKNISAALKPCHALGCQSFCTQLRDLWKVQWFEFLQLFTHGEGEEEVGELRVAGKCGAMQVRGDDVCLHHTFGDQL